MSEPLTVSCTKCEGHGGQYASCCGKWVDCTSCAGKGWKRAKKPARFGESYDRSGSGYIGLGF